MMMMTTNDNINPNTITITTEERIMINAKYLEWLYAKSRERKKQNKGLLLDIQCAIELIIRDALSCYRSCSHSQSQCADEVSGHSSSSNWAWSLLQVITTRISRSFRHRVRPSTQWPYRDRDYSDNHFSCRDCSDDIGLR